MPAATDEMEAERERLRLRRISILVTDFVGPLPENSHCHICLEAWHPSNEDNIICKDAVRIQHRNCQCHNIVIGRTCITSWLLEKDTCPMCRQDLFQTCPPHLHNRPPPLPTSSSSDSSASETSSEIDFDTSASDADADIQIGETEIISSADLEDETTGDETGLEEQSWLYSNGNYLHDTTITSGEHFNVLDIMELFLSRQRIEKFQNEAEKVEYYESLPDNHGVGAWELAYQELVHGRPQVVEDLFTVHGPVCMEGQVVGDTW